MPTASASCGHISIDSFCGTKFVPPPCVSPPPLAPLPTLPVLLAYANGRISFFPVFIPFHFLSSPPPSRVLLAYANGICILWDFHDLKVLAVRGGSDMQRTKLQEDGDRLAALQNGRRGLPQADGEDEEDDDEDAEESPEISCVCWACPVGSVFAVGYTDGDIALWALPFPPPETPTPGAATANRRGTSVIFAPQAGSVFVSQTTGIPLRKVQLATTRVERMPISNLCWAADTA